ncbi:MAG: PIN domain nuclease [Candidatus Angelobacter sp. Gp1-AA117]|nr:MAG: PIN domain nuclease [Candidatus Angelobacter sp. Gp1-AA117]
MAQNNNNERRPLVFLDTNVLMEYLRGKPLESRLLSDQMLKQYRFAVNPVVLSELLLAAGHQNNTDKNKLEHIQEFLQVLPVNNAELHLLLDKIQTLRNRAAHSNDLLIYSSAAECDYLLTKDDSFKNLQETERPIILTTQEFLEQAEHRS